MKIQVKWGYNVLIILLGIGALLAGPHFLGGGLHALQHEALLSIYFISPPWSGRGRGRVDWNAPKASCCTGHRSLRLMMSADAQPEDWEERRHRRRIEIMALPCNAP